MCLLREGIFQHLLNARSVTKQECAECKKLNSWCRIICDFLKKSWNSYISWLLRDTQRIKTKNKSFQAIPWDTFF